MRQTTARAGQGKFIFFRIINLDLKFGWRNLQGFGTVKFLLVASERSGDRGLVQRSAKPKSEELFSRAFLSSAKHNQE